MRYFFIVVFMGSFLHVAQNANANPELFLDVSPAEHSLFVHNNEVTYAKATYFARDGHRLVKISPSAFSNRKSLLLHVTPQIELTFVRTSESQKKGSSRWRGRLVYPNLRIARAEDGTELSEEARRDMEKSFLETVFYVHSWDRNKRTGELVSGIFRPDTAGQGTPDPTIARKIAGYFDDHDIDAAVSVRAEVFDPDSGRMFFIEPIKSGGDIYHLVSDRDPSKVPFIQLDSLDGSEPSLTERQQIERGKYDIAIARAKERQDLQRSQQQDTSNY